MGDERTVPALVSVYKAEVWRHLGFCGNVRPGTVAQAPPRSRRLPRPCEKPLRGGCSGRQGRCAAAAFSVSGAQLPSPRIIPTLGFFFCKVAGKNPWSRVAFFWAYFTKYGCLLGKSDKQLRFFIYVRRILQYID